MARLAKEGFWAWVKRTKPKGFDSLEKWLNKYIKHKELDKAGLIKPVKTP